MTQGLLSNAASALKRAGKEGDQEAISQTLHNTVRYVEVMITDARAGNTPGELHEYNFVRASSKFCPCFPFC